MKKESDKWDKVMQQARENTKQRAKSYREQALKLFPWVCGRCARAFDHKNLQLLEVHHKNNDHDDNPPDGSNWELLCTYCHENEHSKIKDSLGRDTAQSSTNDATYSPFSNLKDMMNKKN